VHRKFEMRSLSLPEIIAIGVWLGIVNPNLGEEEVVGGRRWYHSKERFNLCGHDLPKSQTDIQTDR